MNQTVTNIQRTAVPWQAIVPHVREVTIVGEADLAYWQRQLAREGLQPVDCGGCAKMLISAPALKFMGMRFCEFTVTVAVEPLPGERGSEAVYLPHAFSSNAFFAWCERTMFSAPYFSASIAVQSTMPASIGVAHKRRPHEVLFLAKMSPRAEGEQAEIGAVGFEGPIYLAALQQNRAGDKLFYGRIAGETQAYPFLPERDMLTFSPGGSVALQHLWDARFVPRQWLLRQNATHSKSKTVHRA